MSLGPHDPGRATDSAVPPTAEGYLHQLGIYTSDEEFRDYVFPFALGGLEAGEPVVFGYDEYKTGLLQSWLPDTPSITYLTDMGPYATPPRALASWRQIVEDRLAAGALRIRIAGDVPHPGYGRPYAGWDRYEAALDRALGDLPVWAPCLYDARVAPADVLDTARRRHRFLLDSDGTQRANDAYEDIGCLADFLPPPTDPLQLSPPDLEFLDPRLQRIREIVGEVTEVLVSRDQCDDLVLAVSEAVTNAFVYGQPPIRVRMWLGADRVVIDVHDGGRGPADPLAGFLPSRGPDAESGRGLWLAHRLGIDVDLVAADDGFTVRLRAGVAAGEPSAHRFQAN